MPNHCQATNPVRREQILENKKSGRKLPPCAQPKKPVIVPCHSLRQHVSCMRRFAAGARGRGNGGNVLAGFAAWGLPLFPRPQTPTHRSPTTPPPASPSPVGEVQEGIIPSWPPEASSSSLPLRPFFPNSNRDASACRPRPWPGRPGGVFPRPWPGGAGRPRRGRCRPRRAAGRRRPGPRPSASPCVRIRGT